MREIPLRGKKGGVALVSDEDYDRLSQYRWHQGAKGYVESSFRVNGKTTTVRMHRFLMQALPGVEVDHINRNKLDNRRRNLRLVTDMENNWNAGLNTRSRVGYRGVMLRKDRKGMRFVASIKVHGKSRWLGTYDTPQQAAEAYCQAKRRRDAGESV